MAPYMETPASPSPLVFDGEISGIYNAEAQDLPKCLGDVKVSIVGDPEETTGADDSFVNGGLDLKSHAIPLNPEFAYTPRKLRVITIGAGFSGLIIAHKFQHRFPELQDIVDHTIFEARSDLGGTWLVNTYPGVQCDVPSHIYVRQSFLLMPSLLT
jgi:hypothetical protein